MSAESRKLQSLRDAGISDSFELLCFLRNAGYLAAHYVDSLALWWPNAGSFEVVVGAVLVQNAQWERVRIALANLRERGLLDVARLSSLPAATLQSLIAPAGLYRKKSLVLQQLCAAIVRDFGDFETMREACTRDWLLRQKGIGQESADSILCYALLREEMVADRYAHKILRCLGYTLEDYAEIKEWLAHGIYANREKALALYGAGASLQHVFARFHGKIDEFAKENRL